MASSGAHPRTLDTNDLENGYMAIAQLHSATEGGEDGSCNTSAGSWADASSGSGASAPCGADCHGGSLRHELVAFFVSGYS